jgi:hypothetical protein
MGWGRCLRIRVVINLREPLERGQALVLNGTTHWVTFKYEKLYMFSILNARGFCMVQKVAPLSQITKGIRWRMSMNGESGCGHR